jgi:pyridoxine 5-phosphate synthase
MCNDQTPDPIAFAISAENAGVDGIIVQLNEDRSDILDRDIDILKQVVQSHFNLAISLNDDMIKKALNWLPDMVTLLPSTDESLAKNSLDVSANLEYVEDVTAALRANKIVVSVLVEPEAQQVRAAARAQADYVQLNTWKLADVDDLGSMTEYIENVRSIAAAANKLGLGVSIGRGLNFQNLRELTDISLIEEMNVGGAIIARSFLVGVEKAVEKALSVISD